MPCVPPPGGPAWYGYRREADEAIDTLLSAELAMRPMAWQQLALMECLVQRIGEQFPGPLQLCARVQVFEHLAAACAHLQGDAMRPGAILAVRSAARYLGDGQARPSVGGMPAHMEQLLYRLQCDPDGEDD